VVVAKKKMYQEASSYKATTRGGKDHLEAATKASRKYHNLDDLYKELAGLRL
jgi:hypothetical protein